MSKVRRELEEEIGKSFGDDGVRAIRYLFDMGTLDDVLARRHVIKTQFFLRMLEGEHGIYDVCQHLADEYGMNERTVRLIVS